MSFGYLGSLGRGFGRMGAPSAVNDPLLEAPVLTWTSDETDTLPNFSIDWPDGLGFPVAFELEISTDSNFGGTPDEEILDNAVGDPTTTEATIELTPGPWYARVRYDGSAWSNTETKTITSAGPTGDGILLEDGSSFLLAENNDFIILE